jgi:hypothetical protein
MRLSESCRRLALRRPARGLAAALLALGLASCMGLAGSDRSASLIAAVTPAEDMGSWLQRQQLQVSAGLGRMRDQVDDALGDFRDNAGDALRRVRSRAIVASDACFSTDESEGCSIAARNACQRASYTDGAPLASSTYVACSGVWGMRAGDAPDGACKTKRRLNAALCW